MNYKSLISNKKINFNGPLVITPNLHKDNRGYFFESWNKNIFNNIVGEKIDFVQDNQSKSSQGVLRGMHYQIQPKAQGKLIKVTKGCIYDVIVDLRKESPTFAQWGGIKIREETNNQLWIPIGFAHGFLTLSKYAIVEYKVTNFWSANEEKSLLWNDKDIKIEWPDLTSKNKSPLLSEKDKSALEVSQLEKFGYLF
tara:strand:- start:1590 stop:2177 length:588 start_codon:yes stop_codon:yes gene_type:complete